MLLYILISICTNGIFSGFLNSIAVFYQKLYPAIKISHAQINQKKITTRRLVQFDLGEKSLVI